eukprot:GFUD01070311.1.p1 GENE.GFUD01070311.1~~GFUD01070311.1.p1  ORF type:complete len:248 (-),score=59.47 GFUD01070311.1:13-756(-)
MTGEENIGGRPVQPVYILVEKASKKKSIKESYQAQAATIIGILHIICGAVAFGTGVGLIITHIGHRNGTLGFVGTGIWSSVFFFISGGLSIGSARKGNSCLVISTMVMSIFSAISAGILVIFSGLGLGIDGCNYYYHSRNQCDDTILHTLNGLQLIAGITEMILAITSSSLSCKATCCRGKLDTSSPSRVMYRPTGDLDHDQIVSLTMQMDHPADGVKNTGDVTGDLPRYEDVAGGQEGNDFGYQKF